MISKLLASPPLAAQGDSLSQQLSGLVIVFLALCAVWAAMEVVGFLFQRNAPRGDAAPSAAPAPTPVAAPAAAPVAAPAAAAVAAPAAATPAAVPLAVIAAAVHAVMRGQRYRVRAIATGEMHVEWAHEGRRDIFASHRLR